jgi:hypothetical protein
MPIIEHVPLNPKAEEEEDVKETVIVIRVLHTQPIVELLQEAEQKVYVEDRNNKVLHCVGYA